MPSNFGTTSKNYVSTLMVPNLVDRREILNKVLNVTNEDLSFLELLEFMNRSEATAQPEYHNFINEELSVNITATTVTTTGGFSTANPKVAVSTDDFAKVRVGELVMCPNGKVGYIKAKSSYGSITLNGTTELHILSVDNSDLGLATSDKLAVFSNASGEGSAEPASRRYKISKETNHIQIFKESYEVTDIEMGSQVEFEYNGQSYYFSYEQAQVYAKFLSAVSAAMILGRQSTDTFNDTAGANTITDINSNIVSTTKGLNQYAEEGIVAPAAGINTTNYADITRLLSKARAPRDYMILMGSEMSIAHDNMLNALTQADAISPFAQLNVGGRTIDLGVDAFNLYDYRFTKKRIPFFDHPVLVNFTGSAGFEKRAWFLPMDNIRTADGQTLPRFMIRYIKMPISNQANATTDAMTRYREISLGGLADGVATSGDSKRKIVYECRQGLQVLGKQHFMAVDLV
jgi:hypothetical protein